MKNLLFVFFLISLQISCIQEKKEPNKLTIINKREYSEEYIDKLIDSLQYMDESGCIDYDCALSRKIISIGKPAIPVLLNRIDDSQPTKTYNEFLFYRNWTNKPYVTIGDFSVGYIRQIYHEINNKKDNKKSPSYQYLLKPSEYDIINGIVPDIVNHYKEDSIKSATLENHTLYDIDLYNFFIYCPNYKMPEQERRKRYKEEFIKALNKDLLKP